MSLIIRLFSLSAISDGLFIPKIGLDSHSFFIILIH